MTRTLRNLAEGALFQLAVTAVGIAGLQRWARYCEGRRTHRAG
jgi:hypothetical protein